MQAQTDLEVLMQEAATASDASSTSQRELGKNFGGSSKICGTQTQVIHQRT